MNEKDEQKALWFLEKINAYKPKEALEYWKDYLKYETKGGANQKIVISGPSRIVALGRIKEMDSKDDLNEDWRTYSVVRNFKIKKSISDNAELYFDGCYFNVRLFLKVCQAIFKDKPIIDIKLYKANSVEVLALKIDDDYCFAISSRIDHKNPDTIIKEDGVWFIDYELGEAEDGTVIFNDKEISREFYKWKDGIAMHKVRTWKKYLIDKSYFFQEEEEIGEMMLI